MGQGACMAIEDAAVLANCLGADKEPASAFQQFERVRLTRTKKIVSESWRLGRVAQLENPLLVRLRNTVVRATPPRVMEKQLKFLYDVSFQ
jgi:2-polyprenyl-6-methoxyphenol hydroxylase-like FAD-dependent oxidoreductase